MKNINKTKSSENKAGEVKKKRNIHLTRPQDVRRLISSLINKSLNEEIESSQLRTIAYCCTVLLQSMEAGDIEKRIKAIEDRLENEQVRH